MISHRGRRRSQLDDLCVIRWPGSVGIDSGRSSLLALPARHHDHHHRRRHTPEPHTHSHGGRPHTHHLPEPGEPLRIRTLLAMGFAGGLSPSPSAVVVLLGIGGLARP